MATACGDDDPTAVGIGDVVEAKELPRTPTNQRASDLVEHGFGLDVVRRESRGNVEESVAGFLGLEVSGGPRNEFGQRDGPWLTGVHENALWGGDCRIPHVQEGGRIGERGVGFPAGRGSDIARQAKVCDPPVRFWSVG